MIPNSPLPTGNCPLPTSAAPLPLFLRQHRAAAALFRSCVCGHPQWKHTAFSYGCRESGCHCEFFDEAPVASQKSEASSQKSASH